MGQMALDPREEERQAREHLRRVQKAQRAAAQQRESEYARRLREAATETRAAHPRCRCDFRGVRSRDALREMGAGCTEFYVCPRLEGVRRRMGV